MTMTKSIEFPREGDWHRQMEFLLQKIGPAKMQRLVRELEYQQNRQTDFDRLTRRQKEVLQMVFQGKTTDAIAKELYVSPHTIRTHRQNIQSLLQLENRYEATWFAMAFDLL